MSLPLPPPRQVPVVPRPRHGELSASYLARIALANRTQWRTFAGLLGRPLFPLRMACLKHGYWLYRDGSRSERLASPVMVPEITKTQKRLERLSARYGMDAAVRAYELARYYLREDWRKGGGSPFLGDTLAGSLVSEGRGGSFRRNVMAALLGGASRVHGPRCHVREPLLGRTRRSRARPAAQALLPAHARRPRRRRLDAANRIDPGVRLPTGRHPRAGQLGPPCSATLSGARCSRRAGLRARSRSSISPTTTNVPPPRTVAAEDRLDLTINRYQLEACASTPSSSPCTSESMRSPACSPA